MEQNKTNEAQFPLKILVRTPKGNFVQKDTLSAEDTKLGICIEQKAWMLVKIPTDRCSPEVFLKTVINLTGLPAHFPEPEDYAKLREVFQEVTSTFNALKQNERSSRGYYTSRIDYFRDDEEQTLQNYLQNHRSSYIRLIINLDEM